jgi:LacI family transcriptional regulator
LAVAVPDIADPFFAAVIRGIESVAEGRGGALMVTGLGRDPGRERANVESLLRRGVLGLVVCPVTPDQSYLRPWQQRTPVVFVDRRPSRLVADAFVDDDQGGARLGTAHLAGHGHRRIAFVGDTTQRSTTRLRLAGFHDALAEAGVPAGARLVSLGAEDPDQAGRAVAAILHSGGGVTAVFSSNARCTMGIVTALHDLGRTDVALVGFGDFPMASVVEPAVTVIDQDPDRMGRQAAERIFARLDHPNRRLARRVLLPVRLIRRGSGELGPPVTA